MTARASVGTKRDLYREHKDEYRATAVPSKIQVGPAVHLTAAGKGTPGGPEFGAAIGSLYRMAYTLKFRHKAKGRDFKVAGLEGLWDRPPHSGRVRKAELATLPWRLVLRVPEYVTKADLNAARRRLTEKGGAPPTVLTLERLREGTCIQMLHIGPYSKEPLSVKAMEAAAHMGGLSLKGPLHEIYLSDPNRVLPSKLRTILRIPTRKAGETS